MFFHVSHSLSTASTGNRTVEQIGYSLCRHRIVEKIGCGFCSFCSQRIVEKMVVVFCSFYSQRIVGKMVVVFVVFVESLRNWLWFL